MLKKIYLQLGIGGTNQKGSVGEIAIQAVFKNNWTSTLSYQGINMQHKNMPADYERGYTIILIIPIPDALPQQDLKVHSLTAGKTFQAGKNFSFSTEAGPSIVDGADLTFTRQNTSNSFYPVLFGYKEANYKISQKNRSSLGALVKADVSWNFSSFAALGLGIFTNINSIQSPFGAELKLSVGWMKRKSKN
jgi:hypothetical protein